MSAVTAKSQHYGKPFRMRIESIFRLPQARICMLECRLETGAVTVGARSELVHGDERLPLKIKGVALDGSANPSSLMLTVSIDLHSPALAVAVAGDYIEG